MNNKAHKAFAFLLAVVLCIALNSFAVGAFNPDVVGSITVHTADYVTGKPLSDISFRLYYVALAYKNADSVGYSYTALFKDCNMDIASLEDAYLPVHLADYASTHSLPFTEKTTDANGNVTFENLSVGLYLAVCSGGTDNYYVPSPSVISVPRFDEKNQSWSYNAVARPKMLSIESEDTEGKAYINVSKVWKTDSAVPESIKVSLLCDYQVAETVTLNKSNNWSYRWDNLSKKHSWTVVENDVPDGYRVSYSASENTVTVINTHEDYSDKVTSQTHEQDTSPSDTEPSPEEELIYTGQLNWPVPVFAIGGLLVFSAGWVMLNSAKKDEDTL